LTTVSAVAIVNPLPLIDIEEGLFLIGYTDRVQPFRRGSGDGAAITVNQVDNMEVEVEGKVGGVSAS
jgi:hypothetical protein